MRRVVALGVATCAAASLTGAASAKVLRVGAYHGVKGQFRTVQAAVNAAKPRDWILIASGDYKTSSSTAPAGADKTQAAVLITKPNLHLRGLNRNTVLIDGTKPGSGRCSASQSAQNFGPGSSDGALASTG